LVNRRGLLIYVSIILGSLVTAHLCALAANEETEQARKHYQEAQKQFDMGMWDAAITEFSKAYELRQDPTFLFNMAQAYRRAGNARRAIDLYKNYLIKVPRSPQRADIEERIQNLQRQLDEEDRGAKRTDARATAVVPEESKVISAAESAAGTTDIGPGAVVTTSPETSAAKPLPTLDLGSPSLRLAGLVTGAAGVTGIGAGIFFSLHTKSLSDSVSNARQFNLADAQAGKRAATLQWFCYGVVGAALVTGGLLYWKGRARDGEPIVVSFVPILAPTNAGLLAAGSF
jgi:tetratricopeptide (TPR) repeat protein